MKQMMIGIEDVGKIIYVKKTNDQDANSFHLSKGLRPSNPPASLCGLSEQSAIGESENISQK